MDTQGSMLHND